MPKYDKLVRDLIPSLIEKSGSKAVVKRIENAELEQHLLVKLQEEISEYNATTTEQQAKEELADVMEVIFALAKLKGITGEELETFRLEKCGKRGGFEQGIFLVEVHE
ncbi:nucleoside triphosphate pyrophosphohydrolase [Alkalihalobacillus pseudalcaliphilus]|uniref:nucleoside triphosphate pyrophosphohydrolase n=1 Tax=Alkalihalobacillus pseudalcaliphilus TaxID=79884 RepID=UPI00064D9F7A|nr:nucleoside triphosphate pyrophosphohydrolase [Alkalihalobacillus pseudalcaliphilus]KMK75786.1 hypothetical protein AB990_10990 [Alkalihalobacillus pseudalcaliphilus]